MPGIKHLIECHCFLKIFNKKQINHKFPVYSKLDEQGNVVPRLAKCNNCEAMHYVTDVCKSELRPGKEDVQTILDKEDITMMLPDKIANVLIKNNADVSDFEHSLDIIENEAWGSVVVVKRSIVGENEQVKAMEILSENRIKIYNKDINKIIKVQE
jgi:hypothetical protein